MRSFLICVCLALFAPTSASAQQRTYFLIDVSKSMADKKDERTKLQDANDELARQMGLLPKDAEISRTYFGANNGGVCGTKVRIEPFGPVGSKGPLVPDPANDTPLAEALDAALDHAQQGPANIVIITDGSQSCKRDLCTVARERLPGLPNISVRIDYVRQLDSDVEHLQCVEDVQAARLAASSLAPGPDADAAASAANEQENAEATTPPDCSVVGINLFWAGVSASIFLIVLVLMFGSVAADFERRAARWQKRRKEPPPTPEGTTAAAATSPAEGNAAASTPQTQWQRLRSALSTINALTWATFFVSGAVLAFFLAALQGPPPCGGEESIRQAFGFADSNFGSKFLPGLFISFVGWILIQFWRYITVRQANDNNEYLEHLRAEEQLRKIGEGVARLAEARAEFRGRWADIDQEERANEYLVQLGDPAAFKIVSDKMIEIRERIEASITKLESNRALKRFLAVKTGDYRLFFQVMKENGLVTPTDELRLRNIFEFWSAYVRGRTFFDKQGKEDIAAFETAKILMPQVVEPQGRRKAVVKANGEKRPFWKFWQRAK